VTAAKTKRPRTRACAKRLDKLAVTAFDHRVADRGKVAGRVVFQPRSLSRERESQGPTPHRRARKRIANVREVHAAKL
jgi:hypothetical protein